MGVIDRDEMWQFIAIQILLQIHNKPRQTDNWSQDPFLYTGIFGKLMTRDRFQFISSVLHCSSDEVIYINPGYLQSD
jgi:hypothetical protein